MDRVHSVDFRDGKFVFADGSVFPDDSETLSYEARAEIKATGAYVAYQIEMTRRMHPEFDKLLKTEKGRKVVAALIASWTEQALRIAGDGHLKPANLSIIEMSY